MCVLISRLKKETQIIHFHRQNILQEKLECLQHRITNNKEKSGNNYKYTC